jgi:predicted adenylyl cyclase CyaB
VPRNVEIKARAADLASVRPRAEALADGPCVVLHQDDTFFGVARGRLKLRILGPGEAELIYYERPDVTGPKECRYARAPVQDADALHALLSRAFPVLGHVRKRRTVFLVGQTRIHLDEVEGLGDFVELEVVLRDEEGVEEGARTVHGLMRRLGLRKADLIECSYLDLLTPPQSHTL